MKNSLKKLTALMIACLAVGCAPVNNDATSFNKSEEQVTSEKQIEKSSSEEQKSSSQSSKSSEKSSSSSKSSSSEQQSGHKYSSTWSYDDEHHWHACTEEGCRSVKDYGEHVLSDWTAVDPSTLSGADKYAYVKPEVKKCSTCGYYQVRGTNILPELKFNFNKTDPNANFATIATKKDLSRPEVGGTFSLGNCDSQYQFSNVPGTMKVRGNQTAGWSKKAFRMKFSTAQNVLGLNKGQKYKKWILLADAKDTTLSRSLMGLYLSKRVSETEAQIWVADFTPVTVYLNDEYWGFYYLCEQKEVKEGRINLPEPAEGYVGTDIGYCFELDHYADSAGASDEASEIKKGVDGDPTFRMRYLDNTGKDNMQQGRPSGSLATGQVYTYTMLSDITDGPSDAHIQADYSRVGNNGSPSNGATKTSNSNQLTFIRGRMEALYTVLYSAGKGIAKDIDANNNVIDTSLSVQETMAKNFDLDAWVDGYIINAVCIPPDLGYSSFYMSFDNSPTGDKKLRFDCPWDFDSNFGNRNGLYLNSEGDEYCNNTYNTWLYSLSKVSFFKDMVKAKWNQLRNNQVFEQLFHEVRAHFSSNDGEIKRNHYKWPQNDAAHIPPNNFDELRSPFKEPSQYKEAETETISWLSKRVNYLEKQWGTGRGNVNTNL